MRVAFPNLPISLVAAMLIPLCPAAHAATQDARAERVDALFAAWDTRETPGAVVAVIKDGDFLYQQAYGMADLERDVPLSTRSIFDIASISKQFVAFSILLLQEQGKLALDDDIRTYLPEFPDYGQTITLRHMIHHTSGIRDYMDLMELAGLRWENSYHRSEIVDLVSRQKALNNDPGDAYLYSNSGYLLLAEILQRVSGKTLGAFTSQHIFETLGMKASHFYEDFTRIVKHRALSYSEKEAGGYLSVQYIFDVVGDTGLLTHVDDLSRWDRNFYDNVLGKGGSELIERMLTPGQLGNGESIAYAFGLELEQYRGLSVVRHSGGAAGYDTEMMRFPEQKLTVMVLSNFAQFPSTELAERVADIYLADDFTADPQPENQRRTSPKIEADMAARDLDAHTGSYYSAELDTSYTFRLDGGSLDCRIAYAPARIELVPVGTDTWRGGRMEFRFIRDGRGGITGFNVSSGRIRDIYFERLELASERGGSR